MLANITLNELYMTPYLYQGFLLTLIENPACVYVFDDMKI